MKTAMKRWGCEQQNHGTISSMDKTKEKTPWDLRTWKNQEQWGIPNSTKIK